MTKEFTIEELAHSRVVARDLLNRLAEATIHPIEGIMVLNIMLCSVIKMACTGNLKHYLDTADDFHKLVVTTLKANAPQ